MLILQNLMYIHPNRDILFDNIQLNVSKHTKIALIGPNGAGKSTLLKIMAGLLQASKGNVLTESNPYYVPQHFGQYNNLTIAQALGINEKLDALKEILDGNMTEQNLNTLGDDWNLEERCSEALNHWKLEDISLDQSMENLSGGQKTKVFLAGILINQPELVLLDEPSNHLDLDSRNLLYNYIKNTNNTLVVVSHDRTLLNLLDMTCELSPQGINTYGGNFDFYHEQKLIASQAKELDVKNKEKALRKAKEIERETIERQQKLDARGKKKQEKAGLPTISMNTFKNNAEKSTSRIKNVHAEKVGSLSSELRTARRELAGTNQIKVDFDHSHLHIGKVLFSGKSINVKFGNKQVWKNPLDIEITSGERISIKGSNGSGKTTLLNVLLDNVSVIEGKIYRAQIKSVYIDQDYSLIDERLSVYAQAQKFNENALPEHEIKLRLNRFLFTQTSWDKPCKVLSGGEKMRLLLCCLMISQQAPDLMVLDEPTNNLDIQNLEILTSAIRQYKGTLVVVSHDERFLDEIEIRKTISFV